MNCGKPNARGWWQWCPPFQLPPQSSRTRGKNVLRKQWHVLEKCLSVHLPNLQRGDWTLISLLHQQLLKPLIHRQLLRRETFIVLSGKLTVLRTENNFQLWRKPRDWIRRAKLRGRLSLWPHVPLVSFLFLTLGHSLLGPLYFYQPGVFFLQRAGLPLLSASLASSLHSKVTSMKPSLPTLI